MLTGSPKYQGGQATTNYCISVLNPGVRPDCGEIAYPSFEEPIKIHRKNIMLFSSKRDWT
jgi:hypothetical protein